MKNNKGQQYPQVIQVHEVEINNLFFMGKQKANEDYSSLFWMNIHTRGEVSR